MRGEALPRRAGYGEGRQDYIFLNPNMSLRMPLSFSGHRPPIIMANPTQRRYTKPETGVQ